MAVRKRILTLFAGVVVFTAGIGWTSYGHADNSTASVQDLSSKIDQLKAQIDASQKKIADLKNQKASIDSQLAAINNQIQLTDQQISLLNDKLRMIDDQITAVTNKITQTQKQLAQTDDLLRKRLQVMYENGDVSYLSVLMNSTDFNDFVDRLNLLTLIVKQDKELLTTIKNLKEQLLTDQANLKSQQDEQLKAKDQLNAILADQQNQKDAKTQLEAQVNQNIAMTQDQLNQDQQQEAATETFLAAQIAAQQQQYGTYQGNPNSKWIWPVPSSHLITSGYGMRGTEFHKGVDIGAPLGTTIVAVADGRVLFSGTAEGFGHWIVIQHGPNLMSVYGHMYASGLLVSAGQEVKAGQAIAKVGSDGESTGPHLHFSVATGISGGQMLYVNPNSYLP